MPIALHNLIDGGIHNALDWVSHPIVMGVVCGVVGLMVLGILCVRIKRWGRGMMNRVGALRELARMDGPTRRRLGGMVGWLVVVMMGYVGVSVGVTHSGVAVVGIKMLSVLVVIVVLRLVNALVALTMDRLMAQYDHMGSFFRTMGQVFRMAWVVVGGIAIMSILLNQSPGVVLSSLGALTALFLLIFKDALLGLVASIQVSVQRTIAVGDWVDIPALGVDGAVTDINMFNILVTNWDKTTSIIPTHSLANQSIKNWRGVVHGNKRRIKQTLWMDGASVSMVTPEDMAMWPSMEGFHDFFTSASSPWNRHDGGPLRDESLTMSNLAVFRYYFHFYLSRHEDIDGSSTILVRQMQPGPTGMPVQVYCFANTADWAAYEAIQGRLLDEARRVLTVLGLRLYQYPTEWPLRSSA